MWAAGSVALIDSCPNSAWHGELGGDMTRAEITRYDESLAAAEEAGSLDDLCTIKFCAERCRYTGRACEMINATFPAPGCERMSTTEKGDLFGVGYTVTCYNGKCPGGGRKVRRAERRNALTQRLVRARVAQLHPTCEAHLAEVDHPMMFPEECAQRDSNPQLSWRLTPRASLQV